MAVDRPLHQERESMTEQTDLTVMIRIEGKPFRCDCGCNVFRKRAATQYSCNACDNWYAAEAPQQGGG